MVFLAIASLTVTLYRLCLVAVSFYIVFVISLFFVHVNKYYHYCNHAENIFAPSVNQPCVCTPYVQESLKIRVLLINKDIRKYLARKNRNDIFVGSWNNPIEVQVESQFSDSGWSLPLHIKLDTQCLRPVVLLTSLSGYELGGVNTNSHHLPSWGCRVTRNYLRSILQS